MDAAEKRSTSQGEVANRQIAIRLTELSYAKRLYVVAAWMADEDYGAAVDKEDFTYVPWGPNSNTYATGAWREITGSIPRLPPNVNAPGYGRTPYLRR